MTNQKKQRKLPALLEGDRPILCPPDAAGRSLGIRLFGMSCRLLVIAFAAAGLAATVTSAVFLSVPHAAMIGLAFLAVFAMGAMSLHPIATAAGALLSVGVVLVKLLASPYGPIGYVQRLVGHGWNAILTRLYNRGYYNVVDYYVGKARFLI